MKILVLVAVFSFLIPCLLFGTPITVDMAVRVADHWWVSNSTQDNPLRVADIQSFGRDGYPLIWLIQAEDGGFVLVSSDDAAHPILGYDLHSQFNYPVESPAVSAWIEARIDELWEILNNKLDNTDSKAEWDILLEAPLSRRNQHRSIAPLITTSWDQGYPYNVLCPSDTNGPGGHVWAGCGAVAMAQVMRYWTSPLQGTGSHTYYAGTYGMLSADFGQTTYNWDNMPNTCSPNNMDIPLLLYHCGVSVNMGYSPSGSGCSGTGIAAALSQYFCYAPCSYYYKSNYSTSSWNSMLRASLNAGRPIVYRGEGSSGGHLFNLDGYQNEDYFHFNWGWSGSYDGFYYLSNLNPGSYSFTSGQGAILDIHPSQVMAPPQNLTINTLGYQVNLDWDTPSATGCLGYKVFRNGALTATINGSGNSSFCQEVLDYGEYTYQVSAIYSAGQSNPSTAGTAIIGPPSNPVIWHESFDQPQGWTAGQYWSQSQGRYLLYANPSPSNYDTSLISPLISLPANARSMTVTMMIRDVAANTGEVCDIAVLVNSQPTVIWIHNSNQDWGMQYGSPLDLNLSQFAGQSVQIRFRSYGGLLSNLGYWYIHDLVINGVMNLDVSGEAINTGAYGSVGQASQISIGVQNTGLSDTGPLQVSLWQAGTGILETQTIAGITVGNTTQCVFSLTPSLTGSIYLYAMITLPGDMYPENNYSQIASLEVMPQGYIFPRIGNPNQKYGSPVYANGFTGLHQTIYLNDEINAIGVLHGMVLPSHFGIEITGKPLKIWMKNTALSSLSSIISVEQSTLVFDGVLNLHTGERLNYIPFAQPFVYTGQNLLVSYYSTSNGVYGLQCDFWHFSGDSSRNRGIYSTNSSQVYDPLNPVSGYSSSRVPCVIFVLEGYPVVNVSGRVVNSENINLGIAGATIAISGAQTLQGTCNDSGFFSLAGIMGNSAFSYTISAPGFQSCSGNFDTTTTNLNLGVLPLAESIIAPQNVEVTVSDANNYSVISWAWGPGGRKASAPPQKSTSTRTQTGFVVYRLLPSQQDQPDTWTLLSSVAASNLSYLDADWNNLVSGEYIYAVTTQYNYTSQSGPAFSPIIERFTDGRIIGSVSDLDGVPIQGALMQVSGSAGFGPFSAVSDSIGYYCIPGVHYGSYNITCSHLYYQISGMNLAVTANQDSNQDFMLTDLLLTPQNISANIVSDERVEIVWEPGEPTNQTHGLLSSASGRSLTGYCVYRSRSLLVSVPSLWMPLGSSYTCAWTDSSWYELDNDSYVYIIQANYSGNYSSQPGISNELVHLHYAGLEGFVINNDSLAVDGALITITSLNYNSEAVSDSAGFYGFTEVLPDTYQITCTKPGYQDYAFQNLELPMHQISQCDISLQELILPPNDVQATLLPGMDGAQDQVLITWQHPDWISGRNLLGFRLWRLNQTDISDSSQWVPLNTELIDSLNFADPFWPPSQNGEYRYAVAAIYSQENSSDSIISNIIDFSIVTQDDPILPAAPLRISANPNPFRPSTSLEFSLVKPARIHIEIFNCRGQKVANLVNGVFNGGTHQVIWDGKDASGKHLSSGVYILRMSNGKDHKLLKLVLMK